ncbi:MAG: DsbA family protein [Bacteroidetes bacterium]|nr:DsbA family protein [Bacteroidota bacterium]
MHTLYYFMDPHCGWCYGFKPVMNQIRRDFQDRLEFKLILGGMITGDRVGPVGRMSDYLRTAIPRLEEMTGVTMGESYKHQVIEIGTLITDSTPPSLAVLAMASQKPGQEFTFMETVQDRLFQDGADLNVAESYQPVVLANGLDWDQWLADWKSDPVRFAFSQDVQFTQQIGVSGFPTVVLVNGNTGHLAARGYVPYAELKERVETWLQNQNRS